VANARILDLPTAWIDRICLYFQSQHPCLDSLQSPLFTQPVRSSLRQLGAPSQPTNHPGPRSREGSALRAPVLNRPRAATIRVREFFIGFGPDFTRAEPESLADFDVLTPGESLLATEIIIEDKQNGTQGVVPAPAVASGKFSPQGLDAVF
jgi:hypothetical protein